MNENPVLIQIISDPSGRRTIPNRAFFQGWRKNKQTKAWDLIVALRKKDAYLFPTMSRALRHQQRSPLRQLTCAIVISGRETTIPDEIIDMIKSVEEKLKENK